MGEKRKVKVMAGYMKAYICPYKNERPDLGNRFYVPFNPSEITIEEAIGINYKAAEKPEKEKTKYGNAKQRAVKGSREYSLDNKVVLSVRLFFNTLNDLNQTSYEDVRQYISQLYPYTNKTKNVGAKVEKIYFFWGSIAVAGILNHMNVHYTMFASDGKPVRAEVDITIAGEYVGDYADYHSAPAPKTSATGQYEHFNDVMSYSEWEDASKQWRDRAAKGINPRL